MAHVNIGKKFVISSHVLLTNVRLIITLAAPDNSLIRLNEGDERQGGLRQRADEGDECQGGPETERR
jgi:hypothetical protein